MLSSPESIARICVDVLIFAIIGLSALHGWKKGFASVLFSCFRWLICIFFAVFADEPFQNFLVDNTGIDEAISSHMRETMSSSLSGNYFFSAMPEQLQSSVEGYSQNIANKLATNISDVLIRVVSFLLLFLIIIILTGLIAKLIEGTSKKGPIGFINGLLGLCFGLLRGVFIVGVLMLVVFSIVGTTDPAAVTPIVSGIRSSLLGGLFYDSNPILMVFEMF